jgi:hypothetical protein
MSVESIIQQLPEDFVRLMRNWARSNASGGDYAMSGIYDDMLASRYAESRIPIINGEAADVDRALRQVHNRERQAVIVFWSYEGRSLSWLARRLSGTGKVINHETVEARVRRGHDDLQAELRRLKRLAQAYAETARQAMASA